MTGAGIADDTVSWREKTRQKCINRLGFETENTQGVRFDTGGWLILFLNRVPVLDHHDPVL